MELKDRIQEEIAEDQETILEENFDRVKKLIKIYSDGTIAIQKGYRDLDQDLQILVYFIGQRFAYEGEFSENDKLKTSFFYDRLDKSERTIRNYVQELREAGYIRNEGQGEHRLIAENLPDALTQIEEATQ